MAAPKHAPASVLVTGGAGFIGSNYLRFMVPRHPKVRFVNLDLLTYAGNLASLKDVEGAANYAFVQGDIADRDLVGKLFGEHKFTTVVHFAAESHVDRSIVEPLEFVRTNVLGTAVLLDAARRAWKDGGDVRFHHVSTDEVFGALGSDGFFTEETPYDPRSPYSASKAGADHLARAYAHTYGLPVVLSNCSNNYGPYQFPEKLIPVVLRSAMEGQQIPVYGKGENVRDWLHVLDHCEALEAILLGGEPGRTYTVGGRSERKNLDLVRTLADLVDGEMGRPPGTARKLIAFVTDRPGHDFRYAIDCSRIEKELGWKPKRDLETGLRETVRWYLDNRDWWEPLVAREEGR
ncbi:MAG: dTDP-glucose 4,6-dehydratase [Planctomycetota bacterium]|jgi:dTDP-glucose 4,6-dehydratase